jgi:ABC-type uncharacterized transport system YnjBCD ATPase subunit
MKIEIIGVYSIQAREPCHLVELWIRELEGELLLEEFTQEVVGQARSDWQVPWDERFLNKSGTAQAADRFPRGIEGGREIRVAFFSIIWINPNLS